MHLCSQRYLKPESTLHTQPNLDFSGRICLPASSGGCLDEEHWIQSQQMKWEFQLGRTPAMQPQHSWLWELRLSPLRAQHFMRQILLQVEVKQRMTLFVLPSYRRWWVECAEVADGPYPEQCLARAANSSRTDKTHLWIYLTWDNAFCHLSWSPLKFNMFLLETQIEEEQAISCE